MNKEFFLIGFRTTIGKQGHIVLDKFNCRTLREAEKEFERRNNYNKLLERYNLIIAEGKAWIE